MNKVTDPSKDLVTGLTTELPTYEVPRITVMDDEEVLKAFQMTALEISAAGCWWSNSSWAG